MKSKRSLCLAALFSFSLFTSLPLSLQAETDEEKIQDHVEQRGRSNQENETHKKCEPKIELTEEQKVLIKQKKAELKEKYLANIDNMNEEEKKEALKKYKDELFTYMEKELGLTFERKTKDIKPE